MGSKNKKTKSKKSRKKKSRSKSKKNIYGTPEIEKKSKISYDELKSYLLNDEHIQFFIQEHLTNDEVLKKFLLANFESDLRLLALIP